jgi:hypothetical protein
MYMCFYFLIYSSYILDLMTCTQLKLKHQFFQVFWCTKTLICEFYYFCIFLVCANNNTGYLTSTFVVIQNFEQRKERPFDNRKAER